MGCGRVLLADGNYEVAQRIGLLLQDHVQVVGILTDGRELIQEVQRLRPNLVMLELMLPHLNGFHAVDNLQSLYPEVHVAFLTMHTEKAFLIEAFRCGVRGYLVKQAARSEVVYATRQILQGRYYLSPYVTGSLLQALLPHGPGWSSRLVNDGL